MAGPAGRLLRLVAVALLAVAYAAAAAASDAAAADDFAAVTTAPVLVAGGTVVNADRCFRADVYIEGGVIRAVGLNLTTGPGTRVVNASGLLVLPGGVDPHVHLEMPFMGTVTADDYYTGTAAAAAGGTTTLLDFAIPVGDEYPLETYERYRRIGEKAAVDWGLHMAVNRWDDRVARELEVLIKEKGVNSLKVFLAYKGALQVSDEAAYEAMALAARAGAVPMVHAENGDLVALGQRSLLAAGVTGPEGHPQSRPAALEAEATARAAAIAAQAGAPLYVVHVMAKEAAEAVAAARARGQTVIGEAVLAGLTLNDSVYYQEDWLRAAIHVMSPPIRPAGHAEALLAHLRAGSLQLVGTDHCAFTPAQKAAGRNDFTKIPNGVTGVEERMPLLWHTAVATGHLTPNDFVRVTSTAAAQIFNLYPRKGVIAEGSDGDVVVFDPAGRRTLRAATQHSSAGQSIYEGWEVRGTVEATLSAGRVVFEAGRLAAPRGAGRFLPCPPYPPSLYPEHRPAGPPPPRKVPRAEGPAAG
eukprot:tig00021517_g22011.t1